MRSPTQPDLQFDVEGAKILDYSAMPTLLFKLRIDNAGGNVVRSVMLNAQVRIAPAQRQYEAAEQKALVELFGEPSRWKDTLKGLLWTHAVVLVPPFEGTTVVDVPIGCTYDFDVTSAKYFHALSDGEVPLEFLFSGTVFYDGSQGLQAVQVPWDKEAQYRLPVDLWKQAMDRHFPNSAWLRLGRDAFGRLYEFKARNGLTSWDEAIEELLPTTAEAGR